MVNITVTLTDEDAKKYIKQAEQKKKAEQKEEKKMTGHVPGYDIESEKNKDTIKWPDIAKELLKLFKNKQDNGLSTEEAREYIENKFKKELDISDVKNAPTSKYRHIFNLLKEENND